MFVCVCVCVFCNPKTQCPVLPVLFSWSWSVSGGRVSAVNQRPFPAGSQRERRSWKGSSSDPLDGHISTVEVQHTTHKSYIIIISIWAMVFLFEKVQYGLQ